MERNDVLTLTPTEHPDARVRRVGFDLTDPYVEQCWGPVIGPSATMLLRRLPTLWTEQVPAVVARDELGRSLGLGGGTGSHSRLMNAIERTVRFGLATWDEQAQALDVYRQVPGLSERRLERLPEWTRRAHDRLVDARVRQLGGHDDHSPGVPTITSRLDRLQGHRFVDPTVPDTHALAVER
jgi:hypothetical protein